MTRRSIASVADTKYQFINEQILLMKCPIIGGVAMMNKPLVSIVIPVYNGSNYMRDAIDSALSQSYPNCEVIVVNDGSDDDGRTEEIARSYGDKIRYFSKSNGGVASALNFGIKNMKGEYFNWLSHDDVFYAEKIQKQMEAVLKSDDKTQTVLCEYDYWDMNANTYESTDFSVMFTETQLEKSVFTVLQFPIHMCSALIHRSQFERIGMFDEKWRYMQDVEFAFRLMRRQNIVWLSKNLYRVRIHPTSDTNIHRSNADSEGASLYYQMLMQLTDDELEYMFGSTTKGISRIAGYMFGCGGLKEVSEAEKRLFECCQKENQQNEAELFKNKLWEQCGGTEKKVVVYGAGRYGKRLHYELKNRQVQSACYIDEDPKKRNQMILGTVCRSLSDVEPEKEDVLVVISIRNAKMIEEKLRELGFIYIMDRQQIDILVSQYSPQL